MGKVEIRRVSMGHMGAGGGQPMWVQGSDKLWYVSQGERRARFEYDLLRRTPDVRGMWTFTVYRINKHGKLLGIRQVRIHQNVDVQFDYINGEK
jgi:hypothetical protein